MGVGVWGLRFGGLGVRVFSDFAGSGFVREKK